MRLLADINISPRTVEFLGALGHDVIRVGAVLPNTADDEQIVAKAIEINRVILTQDLDFSDIIALSRASSPSLITLRLSSSRVELVNRTLRRILPDLEEEVLAGILVTWKIVAFVFGGFLYSGRLSVAPESTSTNRIPGPPNPALPAR